MEIANTASRRSSFAAENLDSRRSSIASVHSIIRNASPVSTYTGSRASPVTIESAERPPKKYNRERMENQRAHAYRLNKNNNFNPTEKFAESVAHAMFERYLSKFRRTLSKANRPIARPNSALTRGTGTAKRNLLKTRRRHRR